MTVRAKVLEFAATIEPDGSLSAENCPALRLPDEWTAEHLLLAALLRCSLTSFRYHARGVGADASGGGRASGTVTKRESDGRYAFVAIEAEMDVTVAPAPGPDDLRDLVANAERDCFIGATLAVPASYTWRVNGADVSTN